MQTQLEATLAKLISIPSVSNDSTFCHEIISYVRSELEPLGLFFKGNDNTPHPWFYATTQDTKRPDILLAAHLDVVPATPELFTMQKREGKLYGRGVYDMKLAAACYIEFFKAHANELRRLNIGVLFTTDEEEHSRSMTDILATGLRPEAVFIPDGGDNWHVEKRAKGLYGFELIAHGKSAHGSRPWEGDNALHRLLDALQILRHKYPHATPSEATLSVNLIQGGEAINQQADYAAALIDFRSFSKKDLENCSLLVAEMVKKYDLELDVKATATPLLFDAKSPAVQGFLRALRSFTGKEEVAYCESYGASDARFFAEYNIPCIVIEPYGGSRHSADEWLKADDLGAYYQLIEQWLIPKPVTAPAIKTAEVAALI